MRATTRAAMVEAVYAFNACWNATDPTPEDWTRVAELIQTAVDLHAEDVANAQGGRFDGAYYNPARDDRRLTRQLGRIFDVMADGDWHTLEEIRQTTGDPVASISAQLRHLRKLRHGSWIIDCHHRGGGLFAYRMRNPDGSRLPPIIPVAFQPVSATPQED